jgi:riboflavin synthase
MFTGIVRERGRVAAVDAVGGGARLRIEAPCAAAEAAVGDSVAIAGVCLTVVEVAAGLLAFDAVPETLSRTALGGLAAGDAVNVEPALRAGEPLGGHVVQGHVDGLGTVARVEVDGFARRVRIEPEDAAQLRYVVEKGSIAVDGVSLTVSALDDAGFEVSLIPETLERTNLGQLEPRALVNLEFDVLAKYVERLVASR